MAKKLKNRKIILTFALLLILLISTTYAKYVLEKNGLFKFNIKGIAFSSEGLVTVENINYTESTDNLINPERGFYKQATYTLSNPYTEDSKDGLVSIGSAVNSNLTADDMTLALSMIYLDNYKNTDLPDDWLAGITEYLETFRNAGNKTIIRFAYSQNANEDPENINQILSHMDQLKNIFNNNDDIIFAVELGFLGRWGEWHSSDLITSENRIKVIEKALEVVPKSTQILVRRPIFYMEEFGEGYFDTKLGFSNVNKARVGIFDDGYLSSVTDAGTYETTNRDLELKWMSYLTNYTIFGGESFYTEEGLYDNVNTLNTMEKTHITFLNSSYDDDVLNIWKNSTYTNEEDVFSGQTLYNYIFNHLGYRYVLKNSKLPSSGINQGSYLHMSFDINNTGFNNLIYKRPVNIILTKDGKYYETTTSIDPRTWKNNKTVTNELVFKIPGNIEIGDWDIYVSLPDSDSRLLNNDKYYIKFANISNEYEVSFHGNYLGRVTITELENSTDNGFYQVNCVDDKSENETVVKTIDRYTVIDGKKTSKTEWLDSDIIYAVNDDEVYIRTDDEYLYLYTKTDTSINLNNFHILFSTNASTSSSVYNYGIENGGLYTYTTWFNTYINSVSYAKESGFEYKIKLEDLNIESIEDLRSIYLEYIGSDWSSQKRIGPIVLIEDEITRAIDGKMTSATEYLETDIFEETDDYKIYVKVVDSDFWIYAENENVDLTTTPNIRLFLGSKDSTLYKDSSGYMVFLDSGVVRSCTNSDCSESSTTSYTGSRAKNTGVEYKIPMSSINATDVTDILKLRILYMDSNWNTVGNIRVVKEEKIYPKDIVNKTVIFANKPSGWSGISVYLFSRNSDGSTTSSNSWPGDTMLEYSESSGTYAYIIPEVEEAYYVVFTDPSNTSSNRYPYDKQNIFRIVPGKSRVWDGNKNGMLSWSYYNESDKPTASQDVLFRLYIGSNTTGCVHYWGDGFGSSWAGEPLTKSGDIFSKTITMPTGKTYYQIIYTDCSNKKYSVWPSGATSAVDSEKLIPGITLLGSDGAIWVEAD